jgi:hypothetical protein
MKKNGQVFMLIFLYFSILIEIFGNNVIINENGCDINDPDALSAFNRSITTKCKNLIKSEFCLLKSNPWIEKEDENSQIGFKNCSQYFSILSDDLDLKSEFNISKEFLFKNLNNNNNKITFNNTLHSSTFCIKSCTSEDLFSFRYAISDNNYCFCFKNASNQFKYSSQSFSNSNNNDNNFKVFSIGISSRFFVLLFFSNELTNLN